MLGGQFLRSDFLEPLCVVEIYYSIINAIVYYSVINAQWQPQPHAGER